jgi:hypothetical protein
MLCVMLAYAYACATLVPPYYQCDPALCKSDEVIPVEEHLFDIGSRFLEPGGAQRPHMDR